MSISVIPSDPSESEVSDSAATSSGDDDVGLFASFSETGRRMSAALRSSISSSVSGVGRVGRQDSVDSLVGPAGDGELGDELNFDNAFQDVESNPVLYDSNDEVDGEDAVRELELSSRRPSL